MGGTEGNTGILDGSKGKAGVGVDPGRQEKTHDTSSRRIASDLFSLSVRPVPGSRIPPEGSLLWSVPYGSLCASLSSPSSWCVFSPQGWCQHIYGHIDQSHQSRQDELIGQRQLLLGRLAYRACCLLAREQEMGAILAYSMGGVI